MYIFFNQMPCRKVISFVAGPLHRQKVLIGFFSNKALNNHAYRNFDNDFEVKTIKNTFSTKN